MKKLFILLSFILISLVGFSQTINVNGNDNYKAYTADVTVTNTTAQTVYFNTKHNTPMTQDYLCQLDSTSGNHTNVAVALYGQKFATSAWAQIGSTVNWKGTTADTTIVVSNATENRYRKLKVTFTGTGTGVTTVDSQEIKVWDE